MAGDWIKMRVDLKEDPTVFKLAEILGVDELHIVGGLFCFWAWADKHAVDGVVDGATSRLVDKVSCINGFTDAMHQVGWINVSTTGINIPNYDRHNGESGKERSLKNARQSRWRAGKSVNVDATPSTQPSTTPSTREEKRREDINTSDVDNGFALFWSAYPNKKAKPAAAKAFKTAKINGHLPEVLADIESKSQSESWLKNGGQFVPMPATYLNQRRWEDGATTAQQNPALAGCV